MELQIIDGKYEIGRKLGQGGMGAVYEAKNLETGRRVALKLISGEAVATSPEALGRFKREAKAAAALDTQHVVQVLDAGRDPATGAPYMELLAGEDLKQLIRRIGPLPTELALRIAAQACIGLQAAHDGGIVHRDIKSANLYLARRDSGEVVVKILDFGIAKVADPTGNETGDLTRTGAVLGSPRYMSPEQGQGVAEVGPRSDIWSLGIALFEMLTGTTPHSHVDGMYGIVYTICTIPAPLAHERAPWTPIECSALIAKALQIDPANRFASAADMGSALRALLPNSTSIHESMLVPLPRELRAIPRAPSSYPRGSGPPPPISVTGATPGAVLRDSPTLLEVPTVRSQRRRSLLRPLLALSVALVSAGLVYEVALRRGAVALADRAEPSAASGPTPLPEPSASAPAASEPRTVRLAVDPSDATAELDGRATPVTDGGLDLAGALGSVHHVRIMKGTEEASAEIAITALGAVPSALRVEAPPPKASPRPTSGPRPGAPARPGSAASLPKPKRSAPATTFE